VDILFYFYFYLQVIVALLGPTEFVDLSKYTFGRALECMICFQWKVGKPLMNPSCWSCLDEFGQLVVT